MWSTTVSISRLRMLGRFGLYVANLLTVLLLVAAGFLVWYEGSAPVPAKPAPVEAFYHGTIGTELMPLAVALVLPDLFGDDSAFHPIQPDGARCKDWERCFGFIAGHAGDNDGLPTGFSVTYYRPGSGARSPAPFVGFSCALCHTTLLRTDANPAGTIVAGPGSVSLNLFAWLDAFQATLLAREPVPAGQSLDPAHPPPYRVTVSRIANAYQDKTGRSLGIVDKAMIWLWLRQIRTTLEDGLPRFDEPYGNGESRSVTAAPTGPARTQPFRTLIRQVLKRPGDDMVVYTKIATVFSEASRKSAQFDGSITNLYARSSMAALAAGATVANMQEPEIRDNIIGASDYTKTLQPPQNFAAMFPANAPRDEARIERGHAVYRQYCAACHGDHGGDHWVPGAATGQIAAIAGTPSGAMAPYAPIGTDPNRVAFRHYGELPERLYLLFPSSHPFHFERDEMLPSEADKDDMTKRGYVNQPMDSMFLRAPYLHNASVLTLAELINLKKRRDVFYRGDNRYDPVDVGFSSPDQPDATHYFKFDTSLPGNSNKGHDYPWAYDSPDRNVDDLAALLEYLKTL